MPKTFVEHGFITWYRIRAKVFTNLIAASFFSIGKKTTIIPPLRFNNLAQVKLGHHVTINQNCWIQVENSEIMTGGPKIIIEDNVEIGMNATISAAKQILIEENVFTARNVYISDHGHEFHDINLKISAQGIRQISEVIIGRDSWLGQNAVILPGVSIGKHCVIGANSVVNSDIPDYCVAAGVPAKVLRRYNKEKAVWERV